MESRLMFLDCPAYLDRDGSQRCELPAEVRCRFLMGSTGGPLDSAMIRCPAGHWFNGPVESLTLTTGPGRVAPRPSHLDRLARRVAVDRAGGRGWL
jgi:hypothetical protein